MAHRREYDIAFVGLKPGAHEYVYEIKDAFFEAFNQQDFTDCKAQVKLTLDKKTSLLQLKFEIGGTITAACDRCNNPLPIELWDEFHIAVKMVEDPEVMNEQEDDPDIFYISRTESHLNVENWIYEFINLSIPMYKSCGLDNADGPNCHPEAMKLLHHMAAPAEPSEDTTGKKDIWKGLEQFKNLN